VKTFLFEKKTIDRLDDALNVAGPFQTLANCVAPLVHSSQISVDRQSRIIFQGDDQGCFDQIEFRIGKSRDLAKTLSRECGMR
jgi:hypothetical protein